MPSTLQVMPQLFVWDYLETPDGQPIPNRRVSLEPKVDFTSKNPVTQVPRQAAYSTYTDANGYWEIAVIPAEYSLVVGLTYIVNDGVRIGTYEVNVAVGATNASGIGSGVTYDATHVNDTGAAFVAGLIGKTVVVGKITGVVTAVPSGTQLTIGAGWVGGVTPANGTFYTVGVPLTPNGAAGWQSSSIVLTTSPALAPAAQTVGPLTVSGTLTVSALTQGQVVFPGVAGLLSGDPNFTWDNVNKRLALGAASAALSIGAAAQANIPLFLSPTAGASGGTAGIEQIAGTLNAAANSDLLAGLLISYTTGLILGKGALTGLTAYGLYIAGASISATGAGTITDAAGLRVDAPTVGTPGNNVALETAGHIYHRGAIPSLGALQTGIASQSIAGTDSKFLLTVTTTAGALAAGSTLALISFAAIYAFAPVIVASVNDGSINDAHIYNVGITGCNAINDDQFNASTTHVLGALVVQ